MELHLYPFDTSDNMPGVELCVVMRITWCNTVKMDMSVVNQGFASVSVAPCITKMCRRLGGYSGQ